MSDDDPLNDPFPTHGAELARPRRRLAKVSWFGLLWLVGLAALATLAIAFRGTLW